MDHHEIIMFDGIHQPKLQTAPLVRALPAPCASVRSPALRGKDYGFRAATRANGPGTHREHPRRMAESSRWRDGIMFGRFRTDDR